jgi:hypothetical protein
MGRKIGVEVGAEIVVGLGIQVAAKGRVHIEVERVPHIGVAQDPVFSRTLFLVRRETAFSSCCQSVRPYAPGSRSVLRLCEITVMGWTAPAAASLCHDGLLSKRFIGRSAVHPITVIRAS